MRALPVEEPLAPRRALPVEEPPPRAEPVRRAEPDLTISKSFP